MKGPADMGRRERRAVGHPFRWLSPAQQTGESITPRIIRRKGETVLATIGKARTRRQRKAAARVARAMA